MTEPFKGVIKLDIRDSVPDWGPYSLKKAPEGAPNILDHPLRRHRAWRRGRPTAAGSTCPRWTGWPTTALTYTQWHTTALCSPTRSTFLTGRNHHVNRCASITEGSAGFPGAAGRLPAECATIGQVLQDNGYATMLAGQEPQRAGGGHLRGGSRSEWPLSKGFDRFYGFLGGETNQWYPDLTEDNHFIEPPYTPEEG